MTELRRPSGERTRDPREMINIAVREYEKRWADCGTVEESMPTASVPLAPPSPLPTLSPLPPSLSPRTLPLAPNPFSPPSSLLTLHFLLSVYRVLYMALYIRKGHGCLGSYSPFLFRGGCASRRSSGRAGAGAFLILFFEFYGFVRGVYRPWQVSHFFRREIVCKIDSKSCLRTSCGQSYEHICKQNIYLKRDRFG